jgi:hypothetical protein
MRTTVCLVGSLSMLVLACSSGFSRGEMESAVSAAKPVYTSSGLSVEELEKLKPQVALPIRLAVAPPNVTYQDWRARSLDVWSPDEVAVIERWKAPLSEAGVVSDLLILPSGLVEQCEWRDPGCKLRVNREAAARLQADALLMLSIATDLDEYVNPLSVLNITIVGMWLAPGHHRSALTIIEGVMLDNRNEYLYAFARGEGQSSIVRPLVYADAYKAIEPSRIAALKAFGEDFVARASQLRTR